MSGGAIGEDGVLPLKPVIQFLSIAPNHKKRAAILDCEKLISIREGWRDYKPGTLAIGCHLVPWLVLAECTNVRHCLLKEITKEEYRAVGYDSHKEMLADLASYGGNYAYLTMDSQMTVIRWRDPKGWLVDHKEEYRRAPKKLYGKIKHNNR